MRVNARKSKYFLGREGKIAVIAVLAVAIVILITSLLAFGEPPAASTAPAATAAPAKAAEAPPKAEFVGSEACAACHADQQAKIANTPMGKIMLKTPRTAEEKLGCEGCHGPSSRHLEDPTDKKAHLTFGPKSATSAKEQNQACIKCHDKGAHLWWKGSTHDSRGLTCVKCHKVHTGGDTAELTAPSEQELCFQCHPMRKAQGLKSSHMPLREGKMNCDDCHNPHGSTGPAMLTSNSINENCYRCHAEKRGPVLWEHPPVRENCDNCHEPHGSIRANLLKVKSERLCQRCHSGGRHPSTPHGAKTRYVFNHGCLNCHTAVHGSNNPSGAYFTR